MGASQQAGLGGEEFKSEQHFKPKLLRKFQLQKSTSMGLVLPQNLQLDVRNVDVNDCDLGPAYRTSIIRWMAQTVHLPPPFHVYTSEDSPMGKLCVEVGQPLAEVVPPRLNYLTKSIATIKIFKQDEKLEYEHELSEHHLKSEDWLLKFAGWDRHMNLISPLGEIFTWKNSKHITRLLEDDAPHCHGNLKLETTDGRPLAAWKQRRDKKIMGSIHVFEESQHLLPVEAIVVSALCMILQQKCSGMTYFVG